MPIVTQELVSQNGDDVRFRFVDHLGQEYYEQWQYTGPDVNAFLAQRAAALEVRLANDEVSAQLAVAEGGGNPDKVPPDHQTQIDFDRRLIGQLMTVHDIDTLISSLDFWTAQEARNGVNNNARADALGVSRPEYVEADGRFGDLQGVAGGVQTVNAQKWDGVKDAWL